MGAAAMRERKRERAEAMAGGVRGRRGGEGRNESFLSFTEQNNISSVY